VRTRQIIRNVLDPVDLNPRRYSRLVRRKGNRLRLRHQEAGAKNERMSAGCWRAVDSSKVQLFGPDFASLLMMPR